MMAAPVHGTASVSERLCGVLREAARSRLRFCAEQEYGASLPPVGHDDCGMAESAGRHNRQAALAAFIGRDHRARRPAAATLSLSPRRRARLVDGAVAAAKTRRWALLD